MMDRQDIVGDAHAKRIRLTRDSCVLSLSL